MSDRDVREVPAYGLTEAAHYLQMPRSTLRAWFLGQDDFRSVIRISDSRRKSLSFINLVEAHILGAIRKEHKIPLPKVRQALIFLKKQFPSDHPLADQQFETDGMNLFVEKYGRLVNISQAGQLAIRELLKAHLRRIERDPAGLPTKLYLFTRQRQPDEPRTILVDPSISFGRPVLAGTGIATAVLAQRYKAGDSMDELAGDYGRARSEIEEAIRCELYREAA